MLRAERGTSSRAAAVASGDRRLALAIPVTYMNDSGIALVALVRRYSVDDAASLVVVHD